MTYEMERQLLAEPSLAGYTRLRVLSFDRLARFVFEQSQLPLPEMLDEEGRLMVLRGLLARKRDDLKLFRASARLAGFAMQLSQVLKELQRRQATPQSLLGAAERLAHAEGLAFKLQDLATLLQAYLDWLETHRILDADSLISAAAETLKLAARSPEQKAANSPRSVAPFQIGGLWADGFI